MTMQSDPSQLAANNQHGVTASRAWAQDSKRKYQSFSTQLEPIFRAAGVGISAGGSRKGERREEARPKEVTPSQGAFYVCPGWVGGLTQQQGWLLAQPSPGGRATGPTLLLCWLHAAPSPAGHEIRASHLRFNLHAESAMVFSRLTGKHKAGSDTCSTGILGEAWCSCWLTLSLPFSKIHPLVAVFSHSVFPRN